MNRLNKSSQAFCIILCTALLSLHAQTNPRPLFISPNNDGVQDELVIPLSISDKSYISEWALVITDDSGKTVRTIGNKEKRPEKLTFSSFIAQLFAPKEGVAIPDSVVWNGILDSGETAPDGVYHYYVTASDDKGNRAKTESYTITVDNTAPYAEIMQLPEEEKIFGGNGRSSINIEQSGSTEDLWTASITDAKGKEVFRWSWENSAPQNVSWDGKDEFGNWLPGGIYTYRIQAKDKAGNVSDRTQISNIRFDPMRRSINLYVKGSPIAPGGKSETSRKELSVMPTFSDLSGLSEWKIEICSKSGGKIYNTIRGTSLPEEVISYDGMTSEGLPLSDGDYRVIFTALFQNGQKSEISRNFSVDNTAPYALIHTDNRIFSPDGDGKLDFLTITQDSSAEEFWTGEIVDSHGNAVKTFDFGSQVPSVQIWDGTGDDGTIADGIYTYRLFSTDSAGNFFCAESSSFELNTSRTEILLSVGSRNMAFSPNKDGKNDTISFFPSVRSGAKITEYRFSILDCNGNEVWMQNEKKSLPESFMWNGSSNISGKSKACPDGIYSARLTTKSSNGSENTVSTQSFELDTVYPSVAVSTDYQLFSPNGDGKKDTLPLRISTSSEDKWTAMIKDSSGSRIRTYAWTGKAESFVWDGTDKDNNLVPDGFYSFVITSEDKAGNKSECVLENLQVDSRPAKTFVTAKEEKFSPNGDGILDLQTFSITTTPSEGIEWWKFDILDQWNNSIISWSTKDQSSLPATITWNGTDREGFVQEGEFHATLEIRYAKGDEITASTGKFMSWVSPPVLLVRTAPAYFSPDNDGYQDDLYILLSATSAIPFTNWHFEVKDPENGSSFWKTSGKSAITERMIWDGRSNSGELVQSATDYPFEFSVTDELGMTSVAEGLISVDVLVIRDGDLLKMQVPSIIFRSDASDFAGQDEDPVKGLSQDQIDNNNRVLMRIAEILNKFKDYKVTVEGHANNVSGTEEEETVDTEEYGVALVPLSSSRAEYVKDKLIEYGVSASRLSTVGMGGRAPVVARDDKENWWKNRRVEFILEK